MFEGVHTALVTPFKDGDVDEAGYRAHVDRQFTAGVAGVVPVGTTGESPTLSHDEHRRVIELAVEEGAGRGLVIAGTGSNSTREAISLTQAAEKAGANAALLVAPYYNKPSQQGLFEHFKAIAEATTLPIVLYSIPGRCGIEIGVDTTARLAQTCPNIRAMKEAGGSVERVSQLEAATTGLATRFEILSGDDSLTLPFMSVGALGVISVASNLIPAEMVALVSAMLEERWDEARALHRRYYRLFNALLKLDSNPVPIKTALGLVGVIEPAVRRPLAPMRPAGINELKIILEQLEITSAQPSNTNS
ncbi:MAG: 4-hydroxy-tetrahydrodipicolinate synthase [Verrucomicrobiales bacterium]